LSSSFAALDLSDVRCLTITYSLFPPPNDSSEDYFDKKMKGATHPQNIWMNRVSNLVLTVQDSEFKVGKFVSRVRVNVTQIESSGV